MQYIKIRFEDGQEAYQEVFQGYVQRITDLDGNTIDKPLSSCVLDPNPPTPSWALPDPAVPVETSTLLVSKLTYLNAFKESELEAIFTAAKTNISVEVWFNKFSLAEYVDMYYPESQEAIFFLEKIGLIGEGRAKEVLNTLGVPC
jgi:hypothetical protein